jgi:hypothetical protein
MLRYAYVSALSRTLVRPQLNRLVQHRQTRLLVHTEVKLRHQFIEVVGRLYYIASQHLVRSVSGVVIELGQFELLHFAFCPIFRGDYVTAL